MSAASIIDERLLAPEFYVNAMSLALKNGLGIKERVKIYTDLLSCINTNGNRIFEYLDITYYEGPTDNYFTRTGTDPDGTEHFWLELVASIYGISRYILYEGESRTLNNYELLLYLSAVIARASYDGTRRSLRAIYTGSPVYMYDKYIGPAPYIAATYKKSALNELGIFYCQHRDNPLCCDIVLPVSDDISENIVALFKLGYLTVESMGITYNRLYVNEIREGVWDDDENPSYYNNDADNNIYVYGEGDAE